jgi:hypothetical protein
MSECQLQSLPRMAEPLDIKQIIVQKRNRIKRILKRRLRYLMNVVSEIGQTKSKIAMAEPGIKVKKADILLQPGDVVRVRAKEEIQETLNRWNQLNRCSFMEEMWPYCGTTQQVLKRVEKFLDERDYILKKCKGIVILDNVFCEGTRDFGLCDRSCFFFWREEWLEKIDSVL